MWIVEVCVLQPDQTWGMYKRFIQDADISEMKNVKPTDTPEKVAKRIALRQGRKLSPMGLAVIFSINHGE